ncbi:EAL domain-containing protein [Pseudomonas borbori]|uniref:cyclic-guanylate-specific phosphodiesterase n=1 Tax=Pseudomonas borbori TaxID=289003 RepID=A0A1I5P9U2_9PSED|nr:PAS domain S-box-containing protein/diguanylate cyclase (GGDEF) domain-containing protein [Pseudomonas borbori]
MDIETRHVIYQAFLHILAFTILVLSGISLLDYLFWWQPGTARVVLLPDSALAGLLLGLGLLGCTQRQPRLIKLSLSLLLGLALYSLTHNLLSGGPESGQSLLSGYQRMRNPLALLFCLLAIGLLSSQWSASGKRLSHTLGVATLALTGLSLLSYWLPELADWRLGYNASISRPANLFGLSMGLALLCLNRLPAQRNHLLDRNSILTGAFGALITCGVWYQLSLQNIASDTRQSELLLATQQNSIIGTLNNRLSLIQRTAEHWAVNGQLPTHAQWQQESRSYLRDFADIEVIALLDEQLRPQRLLGRSHAATAQLTTLLDQASPRTWLERILPDGKPHMSEAYSLADRPQGLMAIRLSLPNNPDWTLVTSLDLARTLEEGLGSEPHSNGARVYQGEHLLFDKNSHLPGETGTSKMLGPNANNWRLISYQGASTTYLTPNHLPSIVMLFGLAFSLAIMISQRLAHLAIEHSQRLQRGHSELEQSLRRQAELQALNQRIMDHSMDVLCSIDEQGRFTQLSPSASAVLGYAPEELIGQPYLQFIADEDRERTRDTVAAIMAGEFHHGFRNSYRRKDGSTVHLLWSAGWSQSDRTLFAVAHNVTRLVYNEAYAEDQRDILSMISTDQPLAEILKTICLLAESQAPGTLCSVLLVDKQQKHLIHGATPSLPDSFNQAVHGLAIGPNVGSCGTAVYRRQLVIVEDIDNDPLWHEYRELALQHGLRACWSIPLISHHGDVLGTFAIYSQQPGSPDDDHLQLLATVGQLAAIAIERQHDRLRLQASEQRYRSLFTFNPNPVFSFDLNGNFESMNQAGCQLSGYSEAQLLGQHMSMLVHNEDLALIQDYIDSASSGDSQSHEVRCRNSDGQLLEVDITNLPIIIDEQIVGVFAIAKDIGERNSMTRALREALQHSEHQAELLRGLSETAVNLNSIMGTQALLDYMSERLRLLLGAHQSAMSLNRGGNWAQSINAVSLSDKYAAWQDAPTPSDDSAIRTLTGETNQALLLTQEELEKHPDWPDMGSADHRHPPMRGLLAVPLRDHRGAHFGLLQLSDKYAGEFDSDDLAIAQQFAQMAVAVLENNRLMQAVITGERRLKAQLEFTSAITNSIAEGLLAVDRQGQLSFVNPTAAELLGQPAQVLLGQALASYLPLALNDREHNERTISYHGEVRLSLTPQGERYIAYDSAPLVDDDGPQGWVVAFRDITAQKEADKQLRLLKRSLEASYNGALICDALAADQPIIYVNPAFERITGYSAAEAIGRNCRFLQGNEHEQAGIAEIRQSLAEQRDSHVVLRNFRKDGTPFWNDLYIAPVPDEEGEITHFIGVQNDISEQKRFESELAYNASHDVLTGLPNRSLLEDRLSQGCQISRRYKRSLAVMFIDLDGFKPINDSMGHSAGDLILVEVARRMNQQVRPGDTVARLGGDEFIVILPDLAREEDVLLVTERIMESIARPYTIGGVDLHITASIGITLSDGSIEQPMQLIQQADLAMYKAKQQGRNNYQWYTEDLNLKVSERVTLRNELQKAIEAEALELYYQPQIDSRSGRVIGYEALLRWQHAEQGFISPAQFVPIAEDTGQIIPLSEWVLKTACRDARLLLDQGFNDAVMAVNISPVQFQRANFVEFVRSSLTEAQLPAELLELEITETVLLANAERAIFTLHALKDLGVRIAIDDFGTGFSSLNYLKRLPIDKVKIDRSFIQDVISDRHDAAITQGIISMAHHLKLKVIAEGVETESQVAFLKKSHCDEFQGYYFAKPIPLATLQHYLLQQRAKLALPAPGNTANSSTQTLLLLDDEENILRALTRVLRRDGYHVLTANRAQDAFALLAKHEVQVILSDQRMPEMNGTAFFSRVKDLYPDTIRIVLSGYTDLTSVTEAINQGAIYKFLTKPWDDAQLRATVAQAFQHFNLATHKEEITTGSDATEQK